MSEDASTSWLSCGEALSILTGRRRPVIIGESEDFCAFAAFGQPDREAPFFAPVKEASMKASSSWSFPRACNFLARIRKMRSSLPSSHPLVQAAVAGLIRRIFLGEFAPLGACTQDSQNSVKYGPRVLPRPTTTVGTPLRTQHRLDQLPLGIAEIPSAS